MHVIPSSRTTYRDAVNLNLDYVSGLKPELPVQDEHDGTMTVIVQLDDDTEWWKSDDVSRVTTRA